MAMPINVVSRMHSSNSNVRYILFLINFWRALRSYDGIVHDFFIGIWVEGSVNENVDYPTSGLSAMPILFVNIFSSEIWIESTIRWRVNIIIDRAQKWMNNIEKYKNIIYSWFQIRWKWQKKMNSDTFIKKRIFFHWMNYQKFHYPYFTLQSLYFWTEMCLAIPRLEQIFNFIEAKMVHTHIKLIVCISIEIDGRVQFYMFEFVHTVHQHFFIFTTVQRVDGQWMSRWCAAQ